MRRANDLTGVAIVFTVTLPALLAGCMQGDPPSDSGRRAAAVAKTAVVYNDIPEVVITARRPRPKTIVLSARDARSAPH
jgi:hypothetical protein